jgi:NADH-quinone oxidoreductase subunit J
LLIEYTGSAVAGTALAGGAPAAVGIVLFTQYILPLELAAILLLVALIGALLLARRPTAEKPLKTIENLSLEN